MTTGRTFLDSITVRHGPHREMGQFFLNADQDAMRLGVQLLIHEDMRSLVSVYEALQPVWGPPVLPVFNPAYHAMPPGTAFWLSGHDVSGRLVLVQAARLLDFSGTTALQEMQSLRIFFADPSAEIAAGGSLDVTGVAAEAAAGITGRVVFGGGAWHAPGARGRGLSRVLPRIARNLAYTRWQPDWGISLVEDVLVSKGIHTRYGYLNAAEGVRITGEYRKKGVASFVWASADQILGDLLGYCCRSELSSLMAEVDETKEAPRSVQGSSNRS